MSRIEGKSKESVQSIKLMIQGRIIPHLRNQYKGIFSESEIIQHIDAYIGDTQAQYLIEKIKHLISPKAKILDVGCGYGSFVLLSNKIKVTTFC